jgi:NADH-ubiquinone oxidoreductase chain 5
LFIVGVIDLIIGSNIMLKYGILFLIIGGCVKRAQFPFNSWLLSAISAPTPISSLVHSSTLVVAGVFVLLQFRYCLRERLNVLKYIRFISLFIRRMGLLIEVDMKKLIAYSTIRHVALIIYLLRFKLYKIVYFHLNIHAIFKSMIFICFGFVMLSSYHGQDKRLITFINLNPLIKSIYYFSCFCLAGLPFLSGFFSKDLIIEKVIENRLESIFVIILLIFLSVRVYYRIKLLRLGDVMYSYRIIEKSYLGIGRVFLIGFFIVVVINIYISLIFRVRLEVLSFKLSIYLIIIFFFCLSVLTNLNLKFKVYDKLISFKEV